MMRITLARHSGFCMGVKNAVLRIIHEINSTDNELYMYGPLIHNPQTIALLEKRGLKTLHTLEETANKNIAIRTHGVPVEERRILKECAGKIINLTCTRVSKVQSIIKKYSARGYYIIITGDKDHAEVVGLKSYAGAGVSVISDINETREVPLAENYAVVSQTTFDRETFDIIVSELKKRHDNLTVFDTICDSTKLRQDDVIEGILSGNDTLVVIGGRNSANTRRLARIGEDNRIKTLHIETEEELKENDFASSENVLVTAGTSTPGWVINNVLEKLYAIKNKKSNIFLKSALILLEFIVRTNLLSAIAAFFICRITMAYAEIRGDYLLPAVSFLYIFSMYSINNYFEREFLKLSNPYKYIIYKKFGAVLLYISILAMPVSLYLAREYGRSTIALLGLSYVLGFSYSAKPVKQFMEKIRIKSLKRLYYSKIVACFGWIIATVLLPVMGQAVGISRVIALSAWVLTIIFLRMLLLDLIAFQGDLIMGRETLPQWLGTKSMSILSRGVSAGGIIIFGFVTFSLNTPYFFPFLLNIIYLLAIMDIVKKLNYIISLKYELLVDFNFILIAIFYSIL
jgi:(E)-4-hydroxy-3-methyl-but-2-enyl pyrophosphate reductase